MSKHSPEKRCAVIQVIAGTHPTLAAAVAEDLLDAFLIFPRHHYLESVMLTQRESQILTLVAQGCTNEQIGKELFLSMNTIKTYVQRLHVKLSVGNRTALAVQAIRAGLLEI